MASSTSLTLVALSIFVSIFASFTALNLSARLVVADARARRWWILAAALALGGGTWAMHFIGMLSIAMPADYDLGRTMLSLLLPIAVSAIGFDIVSRSRLDLARLTGSGLLVGAGIVGMHYIGMAAMRMPGMTLGYDPVFVIASVVIAVVAATAALWLAFRTSATAQRIPAAIAMGIAISGMHYTAMAGARFYVEKLPADLNPSIDPTVLAIVVVGATTFLLLLALVTAYFDRALATLTAREAAALAANEERYRSLIESTSDMIGLVDRGGIFTYENSNAWRVLGYSSEELIGQRPSAFIAPESATATQEVFAWLLQRPGESRTVELTLLQKNGRRLTFEVVATNLLDLPAVNGIVVKLRDVTERKQLIAQLKMLSETDLLTDALNRRGFNYKAEAEFERVRRTGGEITIVMIDIDYFKSVNDSYGHAAGDLVLAKVASCCRAHIRDEDLLGRLGGEEFAILMADVDSDSAHDVVARLKSHIAASSIASIKGCVSVTASFGVTTVDPATTELSDAVSRADAALYQAKHAGRNCIKISA